MFTITVNDERVYKRLMQKVEQRGEPLDTVLRELIDREETRELDEETSAQKLLPLIDAADLPFDHPFDARDAEDIMSREVGEANWHMPRDDDASA